MFRKMKKKYAFFWVSTKIPFPENLKKLDGVAPLITGGGWVGSVGSVIRNCQESQMDLSGLKTSGSNIGLFLDNLFSL